MSASERILVVDDNEDNRYTLMRRLKREGYADVVTASDGREALRLMDGQEFDLVLLDIMMPEMDGFSVLEQLRASGRLASLPVIVISALDDFESVVRCIEMGAEDYLPKPFNATLLKARIAAVLEKKRLRDEVVRQLAVIREVFGKYVPASVAAQIVADQGQLAPTHATATILYSDIEAFTSIAETMPPEQVVQMLNEYFPAVIDPVDRHGGIVNQFQGDAMLITFNVPVADSRHADQALCAALEMHNYTVHGDAVNLAARLEQLNKEHGTRILISGETVSLLQGDYALEALGEMNVRGRSAPVEIYTLREGIASKP
jgi:class 3 adenylate cyclase